MKNAQKGFTLIELLVVIAIIGVLATAIFVAINPAERLRQTRDSGRKNDISQLASALEAYLTSNPNSSYPVQSGYAAVANGMTLSVLTNADLKRLPTGQGSLVYSYSSDGTIARLAAQLESTSIAGATNWWCWNSSSGVFSTYTGTVSSCP